MSFRQEMRDFVHGFQATASVAQKVKDNRTKPWPWENDPVPLEPGDQKIPQVDTSDGDRPKRAEDGTPVPEPKKLPGPNDVDPAEPDKPAVASPVDPDTGVIPEEAVRGTETGNVASVPGVDPMTTASTKVGDNTLQGSAGGDTLQGAMGGPGFGQTAYKYYRSLGLGHAEAVGWAANAMQESGGDPNVFSGKRMGDGGASGYMFQWQDQPGGPRLTNLKRFAADRGHSSPTIKDQLDFALEEGNPDSPYKDVTWAGKAHELKKMSDPGQAVAHIRRWFERPSADDLSDRMAYAAKITDDGDYSVAFNDEAGDAADPDESILKLGASGVIDTGSEIPMPEEQPQAEGTQPAEMIPVEMVDLSLGTVPQVAWEPTEFAAGGVVNKNNPSANAAGVDKYNPNRAYTQKVGGAAAAGTPAKAKFTPRRIGDPGSYVAPTGPTPSQIAWKKAQTVAPAPAAAPAPAPAPAATGGGGYLNIEKMNQLMAVGPRGPRSQDSYHDLLGMRQAGATQQQFEDRARSMGLWVDRNTPQHVSRHHTYWPAQTQLAEGGMIPEEDEPVSFARGGKVDNREVRESWHAGGNDPPGVKLIDPGTREYSAAHDPTLFTKPRASKAAPKDKGKGKPKSTEPKPKVSVTIENPIAEELEDRDTKRPDRVEDDVPVIADDTNRDRQERRLPEIVPQVSDAETVPQVRRSDGTVSDSRAVEVTQGASPSMADTLAPAPSSAETLPPEVAETATPVIPDTILPRVPLTQFPEVQPSTGRYVSPEGIRVATQIPANNPEAVIPEGPGATVQPRTGGGVVVEPQDWGNELTNVPVMPDRVYPVVFDEALDKIKRGADPKTIGDELIGQGYDTSEWPELLKDYYKGIAQGFARGGAVRQSWRGGEVPGVDTYEPGTAPGPTNPSKAYSAAVEQPDEEDKPDMEPTRELMDGVARAADMGLKYLSQHFQGGDGGAIPEAANQNAAVRFAQGEGAATRDEINGVDDKIDPRRELREGDRHMARLHQMTNWYGVNGKPKEAAASAASLLQYGATRFGKLGAAAATAYQAFQADGDQQNLQNAVRYLEQAYQMIPDGATMNIAVDPNRGFVATRTMPDGSQEYIDITPEQLPGLITGVVDKSLYWNKLAQLADPAGYRQQQGWKHARKEKLDERAYQEGREQEERGYQEGKLGESRSYTERIAAAKAKADAEADAAKTKDTRSYNERIEGEKNKRESEEEAARNKREAEEAAAIKEADAVRKRTDYEKVQPLVEELERIAGDQELDSDVKKQMMDEAASKLFDALPPDVNRWERMAEMGFPAESWNYVSAGAVPANAYKGEEPPPADQFPGATRDKMGVWIDAQGNPILVRETP